MIEVHARPRDDDDLDVSGVRVRGDFLLDGKTAQRGKHQVENRDIHGILIE